MSKDMKVIMEHWDRFVILENANEPKTWGDLGQNILLNIAAERFPRIGKSLLKFGFKVATGTLRKTFDTIEDLEDVLDFIPDEIQKKLEQGSEQATKWLANAAKEKGGKIGAFIVDDLIGMDDSLTKKIPGYSQLGIEDEYEQLLDKQKLKKWAVGIIRYAKANAKSDEPLPNLNKELEKWFQDNVGAHPDTDEPDIRQGKQ